MDPLKRARDLLKAEEVVAIPTETVYGLAASVRSEAAIRRIFEIKERPFFDPLIVHISENWQLDDLIDRSSLSETTLESMARLIENFWPGPLTLILPKAASVFGMITSGLPTVGVRMPRHPLALQLIDAVGPLAAPSANKFGRVSPTNAEHVHDEFGAKVFVLDGGASEIGLESTVIEVKEKRVSILRPGAISSEKIESLGFRVTKAASKKSPGHLEHHYQPRLPLFIVKEGEIASPLLFGLPPTAQGAELILDEKPCLAARTLYSKMRELSEAARLDYLYVRRQDFQMGDLWIAIWDRLQRASTARGSIAHLGVPHSSSWPLEGLSESEGLVGVGSKS